MLQNSICEISNVSSNIYNFAHIFNAIFILGAVPPMRAASQSIS